MQYNKINNLLGWLCFAIASVTYILTLEPSVSFWDCGEFISCAYRLQVAHQPGYPVFAMLGKLFSLLSLGDRTKVPYFTNMGSALASGATIMFLFWTITALAKKLLFNKANETIEQANLILIMGAGLVGALAFTYTDTFWFSAVETIVFAWSSLCTAIVFWAILKWDAHADEPGADKWIIFIAYVIGLSIGIHLLNLLTIPAIAMVYYFRRGKNVNTRNAFITFLAGVVILIFVQYGIRGYTVKIAAYFDLFFVNTLGLGFWSGAFFFFFILLALLAGGIWYTIKYKKPLLNLALLCVAFIYFGYSSFAYIPIRAAASPDLDNSHPDNAFILYGYLNRIQYGENPLVFGQYFDAKPKVDDAGNTIQIEGSTIYRKGKTKYESAGRRTNYVYDHSTIFPRMYSNDGQDPQFYREWLQMGNDQAPTFADNLKWFASWQVYQMYIRYFLWNFVGRYNDQDGQQNMTAIDGNWTSGILDGTRHLPKSVINGTTYTPLFAIPLIIGLFGAAYHFQRKKKDALIVLLLFIFTGVAIVIYVNQPSIQPRERDYSYVGSFYAFAIWIGLGVIALAELIRIKLNPTTAALAATGICLLVAPVLMAKEEWKAHDRSTKMTAHDMAQNYLESCPPNAILFTYGDNDTYSLWYDQEVERIRPDVRIVNLSLFTGDWYIHQMQGKMNVPDSSPGKPVDVPNVNLNSSTSDLNNPYAQSKMDHSDPLPITMPFEKYEEGVRDAIFYDNKNLSGYVEMKDVFDFISSDDKNVQVQFQSGDYGNYLPTKNFKITVNPDTVIKYGVITPDQKDKLTTSMEWKFTSNYVTKENLAMFDILAHNNWKRPICFTTTIGQENLIGLQPYLYKEGFTYHLIPFKKDTANKDQLSKTNSMVMYNNMMTKFKYGNFKTARYLDHESTTMFYPVLISTFLDLTEGLIKDNHPDLAAKALDKYYAVMPDMTNSLEIADRKIAFAQVAFKLNKIDAANKFLISVDDYITDQLDYNYSLLQSNSINLSTRDIQFGASFLYRISTITENNHQTALNKKFSAQLKDYETKFASILQRPE